MGERYLVDTNAAIDYLAETLPSGGLTLLDEIVNSGITISVITQVELLGFQAPESYLKKVEDLISISEVILLADLATIQQAILIRREMKLKLPDAVIAATALVRGLTLVSRNEKDFGRVEGLKYVNPHLI